MTTWRLSRLVGNDPLIAKSSQIAPNESAETCTENTNRLPVAADACRLPKIASSLQIKPTGFD
jgi:hypothetical protein